MNIRVYQAEFRLVIVYIYRIFNLMLFSSSLL